MTAPDGNDFSGPTRRSGTTQRMKAPAPFALAPVLAREPGLASGPELTPGSELALASGSVSLASCRGVLLHGGRVLLCLESRSGALPSSGTLVSGALQAAWSARCWAPRAHLDEGWVALAMLEKAPAAGAELRGPDGGVVLRIAEAPALDVAPAPLAELVRHGRVGGREVLEFLIATLDGPSDGLEAQSRRALLHDFLAAAAERDGFVEILGTPDTGGVFCQGWARSLAGGARLLAGLAGAELGGGTAPDRIGDHPGSRIAVAHFAREDILPPGRGICLFSKTEPGVAEVRGPGGTEAIYLECDGRLLRLDVASGSLLQLEGEAASAHVAQMLPRLDDSGERRAFRRICRPRFIGQDTLSNTEAPVAAAFDAVLRAPDGGMLLIGWMLDPLRRVERVMVRGDGKSYRRLDTAWSPLPRPDLHQGFARDPRFAGLLDDRDFMHGFIVHLPSTGAPADPEDEPVETPADQTYLELILDTGGYLFRPLAVTPFEDATRLPQLVAALSPDDPEIGRIVDEHVAPFLSSVRPAHRCRPDSSGSRPIAFGDDHGEREVAAVVPFRAEAELKPMFSLLAGTPEADRIDLTLVAGREVAAQFLRSAKDAFRFFGLRGRLLIVPDRLSTAGRLDAGVAASSAGKVLCWLPAALPRHAGWLEALLAESGGLPAPGLVSPALIYEDGSICFGGEAPGKARQACALSGYGSAWLRRGPPRRSRTGAAEVALVDRAVLERVGGFSGRLFSDAFVHVDLADRLESQGFGVWCSGSVEFWMLDDNRPGEGGAFEWIIQRVDAALIDRRTLARMEPAT